MVQLLGFNDFMASGKGDLRVNICASIRPYYPNYLGFNDPKE